jgi:phosphatidylglycerol:prolipoprotein diacylglycerol transferase
VHWLAFQIGSYSVHSYGVMIAIAFLAGLWTASRRGLRDGFRPEQVLDAGPWLIVGAILGARIVYVTTYWREQFAGGSIWEIFMIQRGGLVYYGGLIGAALGGMLYVRLKKLPLWKLGDVLAPSIALGYVFGRIGCFLNGCCYGKPSSLPWAIRFPADNPNHPPTTPVHPTQVYDALLSLILYAGLAWLYRRKKFDGQVFGTYLLGYACTRSFVELFRGDYTPIHLHGGLTPAHLISIGVFVTGVVLLVLLRRRRPGALPQTHPS